MRQIYSETPDFANLTSYVADYQSPFFQKSKTAENGSTPEQLLNKFKKYVKDESIILTIGNLIFCGWFACFCYFSSASGIMKVIGWIVVLVSAIESIYRLIRGKYPVGPSDEDITRRLQELIGEE
jgi:hypothetical protein